MGSPIVKTVFLLFAEIHLTSWHRFVHLLSLLVVFADRLAADSSRARGHASE